MIIDPEKIPVDTSKTVADTVGVTAHASAGHGDKFEFSHLLDHIKDSREIEIPFGHVELPQFKPLQIGGMLIDLSPTKHVVFLLVSALILVIFAIYVARRYKKSPVPSGFANAFETMVLFIRDEVAIPNMGKAGVKYVPYLLTTFFFILIMNIIGLIPFGVTSTGNIAVTGGLAIIAFFMIQVSAIRAQGIGHYLAHLTGGVHWLLWPIMIPIEILGLFTKPFALCIRLFANMTGGHIVILSLIGLIFLFRSFVVAPVSVIFALGINMLELFVAFLQAYVFIMLTSLFMGLGMQPAHEEHAHSESH
ncbi:MAG TPA: F0F1 ATP synthase subunit A [Bacteroidota bacterium]|nr:F0F1 ATP synthase subunit A [Bacteroidota bacterium]